MSTEKRSPTKHLNEKKSSKWFQKGISISLSIRWSACKGLIAWGREHGALSMGRGAILIYQNYYLWGALKGFLCRNY
jgi:hypothetical protein